MIASIDKHGFIMNPIIVNENFEVIDGQTRLAACKELGVPAYYIVVPKIGIDECMVLNANSKTWTIFDYIVSYAEQGNENYKRILQLATNGFGIRTYMFANYLYGGTGRCDETIRSGHAVCGKETFERANNALQFLRRTKPYTDLVNGRKSDLETAVLFAYMNENCDNERLINSLSKYYSTIDRVIDMKTAMDELSNVYNRNFRGKRIYLCEDYDKLLRE